MRYSFKNGKELWAQWSKCNCTRFGFELNFSSKEYYFYFWKFEIVYQNDLPF